MLAKPFNEYQVKRGFEVFRRVCAKCHSLALFKPSDLKQLGYTNFQALVITGKRNLNEYYQQPLEGRLKSAKLSNPPDLSLIAKQVSPSFVYRLLTGYNRNALPRKSYFNKAAELGFTLMPPPLSNGVIKHSFKVPSTVCQTAKDVGAFLLWVSEPWRTERLRLFFPIFASLATLLIPLLWARKVELPIC
ncbi:MAG: cytochrome c1 [Candidatus Hodgkinia cicadicola]